MAPAPRYRKHVRNQSHLSVQSMGIIPQLLFERGGEEKLNSSGCFCPVWWVPGWHLMASVALLTVPSSYWYVVIRSVGEITWDVLLAGDWGRIFAACCTCLWYTVFPFISGPTTPIQCSSVGVVIVSAWEIIILSPSSDLLTTAQKSFAFSLIILPLICLILLDFHGRSCWEHCTFNWPVSEERKFYNYWQFKSGWPELTQHYCSQNLRAPAHWALSESHSLMNELSECTQHEAWYRCQWYILLNMISLQDHHSS